MADQYDDRRAKAADTLSSKKNPAGVMVSTQEGRGRHVPDKMAVKASVARKGLSIMVLKHAKTGALHEVHSHDRGGSWHEVPHGKARTDEDQVPMSPRSNQSLHDMWPKRR